MNPHDADIDWLMKQLSVWDRRRQLAEAAIWLPRGLLFGLITAAAVATIARIWPVLTNIEVAVFTFVFALIGTGIVLIIQLIHRRSLLSQATYADRQFALEERVSTAIEIHTGRIQTTASLAKAQLADTLNIIRAVDEKTARLHKVNVRDLLMLLIVLGLLVTAIMMPNSQASTVVRRRELNKEILDQIDLLTSLVGDIEKSTELNSVQKEELQSPVIQAIQKLKSGPLDRDDAFGALSEAEAELRNLVEGYDSRMRRRLSELGNAIGGYSTSRSLAQANQVDDQSQLAAEFTELADRLRDLERKERIDLAEKLATTATLVSEIDGPLASELEMASESLRHDDLDAAQAHLGAASATLKDRATETTASQRAAETAAQLRSSKQQIALAGQEIDLEPTEQDAAPRKAAPIQADPGSDRLMEKESPAATEEGDGIRTPGVGTAAGSDPGGGHVENVYVPGPVDLSNSTAIEIELPVACTADPENCGSLLSENATEFNEEESLIPYTHVFSDYREIAYRTLDEEYIPLDLKSIVRDYFSSLEP